MSKPTKFLMYITSPFSYPIARLLDYIIGEHKHKRFNSEELKVLVQLHTVEAVNKIIGGDLDDNNNRISNSHDTGDECLDYHVSTFIQNVIDIKKMTVIKKFTNLEKVTFLDCDTEINEFVIKDMIKKGYSRIPVIRNQNKHEIIGYIRTMDFIHIDVNSKKTIKDNIIPIHSPIITTPETSVFDVLTLFKKGIHMAVITEQKDLLEKKLKNIDQNFVGKPSILDKTKFQEIKIIGIVTLEDIFESIIGEDIKDEKEIRKNRILSRFKNTISHVVNDVVAKSMMKTLKSENVLFNPLYNKDDDFENDKRYNYIPFNDLK